MEEQAVFDCNSFKELKFEEDEEEFRSCCEDEDELKEREESANEDSKDDDLSVKMFFKGVSVAEPGNSASSGIGVIIQLFKCRKKLEFYVEESVADYLALMDGLSEAVRNDVKRVQAFTGSKILFDQITREDMLENPLLVALKQRILEHATSLYSFDLKYVPDIDHKRPLHLAQIAIGIVSFPAAKGDESVENCSICCEEKLANMMITMKCSHKFCSHCMKTYVDGKVQTSQVPIRCPQLRCGHEFCYSCGAEYNDSQQTCQCAFWDEEYSEDVITHPSQQFDQWAWDSFGSLSTMIEAYSEQERSQLALIQRFLSGGVSLTDHQPDQSPPRCTDSYVDAMKDLHQLPWLERFVSVISNNFYVEYIQGSNILSFG